MKITLKCKKGAFSTREIKHMIGHGLGPLYVEKDNNNNYSIKKITSIKDLHRVITEQYRFKDQSNVKLIDDDIFKGFVTDIDALKDKTLLSNLLSKLITDNIHIEFNTELPA